MNYKLEKFWNFFAKPFELMSDAMNYKLEKFWNTDGVLLGSTKRNNEL